MADAFGSPDCSEQTFTQLRPHGLGNMFKTAVSTRVSTPSRSGHTFRSARKQLAESDYASEISELALSPVQVNSEDSSRLYLDISTSTLVGDDASSVENTPQRYNVHVGLHQ